MSTNRMDLRYVKSCFNYTGGKYKILDQIIPLFPDNISTFIDLFGGGFNVGVNVTAECIIYNDICTQMVTFFRYVQDKEIEELLYEISIYIRRYQLSKDNKAGYLQLREAYNSSVIKEPMMLYTLLCYSFSNQIRFNSKGEFNVPFGKRSFNANMKENFINFHKNIKSKNIYFLNNPLAKFNFDSVTKTDFVYVDPPYYKSTATYNENGKWIEKDEKQLLNILDEINDNGIKFALSNNLKYQNTLLAEWIKKYTIHYLINDYSSCNYQKKDKSRDIEILVTNY